MTVCCILTGRVAILLGLHHLCYQQGPLSCHEICMESWRLVEKHGIRISDGRCCTKVSCFLRPRSAQMAYRLNFQMFDPGGAGARRQKGGVFVRGEGDRIEREGERAGDAGARRGDAGGLACALVPVGVSKGRGRETSPLSRDLDNAADEDAGVVTEHPSREGCGVGTRQWMLDPCERASHSWNATSDRPL